MRRLVFALSLCIILCGCEKTPEEKMTDMGYTEEEIVLIQNLGEDLMNHFMEEYDQERLSFVKEELFKEENLENYLKYRDFFDRKLMMRLVNEGILTDQNRDRISELYQNDRFIGKNEKLYLEHMDEFEKIGDLLEHVNSLRYKELYTDIEPTDMSKGDLVLVNKYHALPEDYEPDDLVYVEDAYGRGRLREKVYEAFKELADDAYELGYDLRVVSSYRSYDYQYGLYHRYLEYDTLEEVDSYSARAGHSEHQTGMAIDVSLPGVSLDGFGSTEASKWLYQNCSHYGFIVRYPADKQDITGYIEEPWHIRYLGIDVAEDVVRRGLTYDEYYACFVEE